MGFLTFAQGFVLIMLGIVALAAIPFLLSLAGKKQEEAEAQNVQTQILVNRYNSFLPLQVKPQKAPRGKQADVIPIRRGKDVHRKEDDNL